MDEADKVVLLGAVANNPHFISRQTGSYSVSVHRILKRHKFHTYKGNYMCIIFKIV
jgi:hypothetical protein